MHEHGKIILPSLLVDKQNGKPALFAKVFSDPVASLYWETAGEEASIQTNMTTRYRSSSVLHLVNYYERYNVVNFVSSHGISVLLAIYFETDNEKGNSVKHKS